MINQIIQWKLFLAGLLRKLRFELFYKRRTWWYVSLCTVWSAKVWSSIWLLGLNWTIISTRLARKGIPHYWLHLLINLLLGHLIILELLWLIIEILLGKRHKAWLLHLRIWIRKSSSLNCSLRRYLKFRLKLIEWLRIQCVNMLMLVLLDITSILSSRSLWVCKNIIAQVTCPLSWVMGR